MRLTSIARKKHPGFQIRTHSFTPYNHLVLVSTNLLWLHHQLHTQASDTARITLKQRCPHAAHFQRQTNLERRHFCILVYQAHVGF